MHQPISSCWRGYGAQTPARSARAWRWTSVKRGLTPAELAKLHRGPLWHNAASCGLLLKQSSHAGRDEEGAPQIHSGLQQPDSLRASRAPGRAAQFPGGASRNARTYLPGTNAGSHLCSRIGITTVLPRFTHTRVNRGGSKRDEWADFKMTSKQSA